MKPTRKELYPGWRMTRAQHAHYFQLWANACSHQGWHRWSTKDREAKRKQIMTDVFGGPKSAKDIDREKEFGQIKARFLMLAEKLKGAIEDRQPQYDAKRRFLWIIDQKKKLLALYLDHPDEYLHTLLKDRFKRFKGINSIDDLSAERPSGSSLITHHSPLEQLIFTLSARINDMRNQAGHTLHEMNTLAGVPCVKNCKMCETEHRAEVAGETFADATDEVAVEPDQPPCSSRGDEALPEFSPVPVESENIPF